MKYLNRLQQHHRSLAMIPGKSQSTLAYVATSILGFKARSEAEATILAKDAIELGRLLDGRYQNDDFRMGIYMNLPFFANKVILNKSNGQYRWDPEVSFVAFQNVTVSGRGLVEFFADLDLLTRTETDAMRVDLINKLMRAA